MERGYCLPRNQTPAVFPGYWGFAEMGYHANPVELGIAEWSMLPFMQSSHGASPLQNLSASWGGEFIYLCPRSRSTYTANAGMEMWRKLFQVQVTRDTPGQTTKSPSVCSLKKKKPRRSIVQPVPSSVCQSNKLQNIDSHQIPLVVVQNPKRKNEEK